MYSATQVSTAAKPTRLWKAATSCGRSEIWIFLAMAKPANNKGELRPAGKRVTSDEAVCVCVCVDVNLEHRLGEGCVGGMFGAG